MSPFQKFSSPHKSPFESSSSVPTYSRMLFGNEYFCSWILMDLESVYNSLFTDSYKMTGTQPWLRRKRERQKQQVFMRQTTTLHVHHAFFCTFLCHHCMTTTWKYLISRLSFWSRATSFFFSDVFIVVAVVVAGAPNENIVQNHLNIALLIVF